ncbi:hypothetical protein Trydic_g23066 [Trypoxylus dichotomus]
MMTGKVFIISIHFVTMVTATRAIRDPTEKKATVLGPLERDQGFCKNSVEDECAPGAAWEEDCNECECDATGFKSCSLLECVNDEDDDQGDYYERIEHSNMLAP